MPAVGLLWDVGYTAGRHTTHSLTPSPALLPTANCLFDNDFHYAYTHSPALPPRWHASGLPHHRGPTLPPAEAWMRPCQLFVVTLGALSLPESRGTGAVRLPAER